MKPQNMESCDWKSGDSCTGQSEIDEHFDMSSSEAQTSLMNLCRRLENFTDEEITSYGIKRNLVTYKPEVACFMSALYKFIQNNGYLGNIPFPFTKESVVPFMKKNLQIYNISSKPIDFNRYFEILVSYWLTNGYTYTLTEDFLTYHRLIGEMTIPGVTQQFNRSSYIGTYGTRLRVVAIEINTTFMFQNLGYREGKPIYHLWEKFIQQEVSKMPSSMKSGFQSTQESWHWIKIQETLVKSAVRGVVIGISLAFPILTITTLNVVIGFLATICITMITMVVVGLIPLIGWKLGVLESINLSLIVGLSVDYVVHFAEAYRTSPFTDRKGRVKSMLEAMGLSVLSGAITTFGAAVFMLFAEIQFSYQFGIFVMCTIGTSFLFSFLLFPAFMASWGPEGNTGSIPAIVKAMKLKCQRKQKYVRVNCDETYDSDIELLS